MLKHDSKNIRLCPTVEQTNFLNGQFGAIRLIYNTGISRMLQLQDVNDITVDSLSAIDPDQYIPLIAESEPSLNDYDPSLLRHSCKELRGAFIQYFNCKMDDNFPVFQSRRGIQRSYHSNNIEIGKSWIKIPKCEPINTFGTLSIKGELTGITITRSLSGEHRVILDPKYIEKSIQQRFITHKEVMSQQLA